MSGRALPDRKRFLTEEVRLGYVSGVFGVRGEVRLYLYNPASGLLRTVKEIVLVGPQAGRRTVSLSVRDGAGKRVLGRLGGVRDPEAARGLIGHELVLPKAELPTVQDGTFYHHQLLGLPVRTAGGDMVGKLAAIHTTGEVDVWEVKGRTETHFIPAVREEILEVRPGDCIVVADAEAEE
jgi:16S rRNA processing protein RimM